MHGSHRSNGPHLKEELEARNEVRTGSKAWLRWRLHGSCGDCAGAPRADCIDGRRGVEGQVGLGPDRILSTVAEKTFIASVMAAFAVSGSENAGSTLRPHVMLSRLGTWSKRTTAPYGGLTLSMIERSPRLGSAERPSV